MAIGPSTSPTTSSGLPPVRPISAVSPARSKGFMVSATPPGKSTSLSRETPKLRGRFHGRRAVAACAQLLTGLPVVEGLPKRRFLSCRALHMYVCQAGTGFAQKSCSNRGFA